MVHLLLVMVLPVVLQAALQVVLAVSLVAQVASLEVPVAPEDLVDHQVEPKTRFLLNSQLSPG